MDFKLYINENIFKTYKQVLEDVNLNFNTSWFNCQTNMVLFLLI